MGKTQEITDEEEKELLSDENERMDDGEFSPQNHIDLRQAVIYSEILNRRYTN